MRISSSRWTLVGATIVSLTASSLTGCKSDGGYGMPGSSWLSWGPKKPAAASLASNARPGSSYPAPPSSTATPTAVSSAATSSQSAAPASYPSTAAAGPPSYGTTSQASGGAPGPHGNVPQDNGYYTGPYNTGNAAANPADSQPSSPTGNAQPGFYGSTYPQTGGANSPAAFDAPRGSSPGPAGPDSSYASSPQGSYGAADYRTADSRANPYSGNSPSPAASGGYSPGNYNSGASHPGDYDSAASSDGAYQGGNYPATGHNAADYDLGTSHYSSSPSTESRSWNQDDSQQPSSYGQPASQPNGYQDDDSRSRYEPPASSYGTPYDSQPALPGVQQNHSGMEQPSSGIPTGQGSYRPGSTRQADYTLGQGAVQQAAFTASDLSPTQTGSQAGEQPRKTFHHGASADGGQAEGTSGPPHGQAAAPAPSYPPRPSYR